MKHHILSLFFLLFAAVLPTHAVLKEKDLDNTLRILRTELEKTHDEMGERQKRLNKMSEMMREKLFNTMSQANQNALMLYSQKQDYVFDLTYACHEATAQYNQFHSDALPFRQWVNQSNNEVARYDSLVQSLSTMPVMMLDERAKIDRNVCLALAVNIRRMVVENQQTLKDYSRYYTATEARLKTLNDYAQKRYNDIQDNIFRNGSNNYFSILCNFGRFIIDTQQSVSEKYTINKKLRSQWDGSVILFLFAAVLFYGIIAVILNQIVLRLIVTRMMKRGMFTENIRQKFFDKRACIIMATTVVTFAVILNVIRLVMEQNFVLMASNLMTEFAWLMSVILISILIRVRSERTLKTFYIYAPLLLMGFIVISFRIVLIPNALVNLIFPPVLLVCMLWQWSVMKKYHKVVDKSDAIYAIISQFVFVASVICSWSGYTLLSVQVLIWWIMQLTCILTITCLKDYFEGYAEKHNISEAPITKTWFYYFFTKVLTPAAAVASVLLSIYWAADVFNLSAMTRQIFVTRFIDSQNFVVSLMSISQVIVMGFLFAYFNFLIKSFVRHHFDQQDKESAESRSVMIINVVQVLVYGTFTLLALNIFHVSTTWLAAIGAGLATGIGFASKDILENIYYGISLMAGRIKIGDVVICDGIRGKVATISYTSTMIVADEGSVIAFTNSQLFTKNYKNLTRNHGWIRVAVDFGIAYGESIDKTRKALTDALSSLSCVDADNHEVTIITKELSDSCVTLTALCWLDALKAPGDKATVTECIYDTLNANGIEIPFPQQDVHIITNK